MEYSPSLRSECMVLPYHKGLIIKNHFYLISWVYLHNLTFSYQIYNISGLDLQQVVSEHFLGHKSGDFFFHFCRVSRAVSLKIRYVSFGSRYAKYDCRYVFFVKK